MYNLACFFEFLGYSYLTITGALFIFQRSLQYLPSTNPPPKPAELSIRFAGIEEFTIRSDDGLEINGWYWPSRKGGKHSDVSILHLQGNAGCSIALLDYRGYGGNEGKPSEQGLVLDAVAGISWHIRTNSRCATKLVLHLESIGSVAGINAMARLEPRLRSKISGIVVEGGLSSCLEVAQSKLRIFPLSIFMRDKWDGSCRAASLLSENTRFLSLHGSKDNIVPTWCGKKLFNSVSCRKKMFVQFKEGGHNDLLQQPTYLEELDTFYSRLNLKF